MLVSGKGNHGLLLVPLGAYSVLDTLVSRKTMNVSSSDNSKKALFMVMRGDKCWHLRRLLK